MRCSFLFRRARAGVALALAGVGITACGRDSAASEHADALRACVIDTLSAGSAAVARGGTLDTGSCPGADGTRYVDYRARVDGGRSYLVVVVDHADTTGRHPRHRRFDAALFTASDDPRELLAGRTYEGRDPMHTLSQMFFIAPDSGLVTLRIRGHGPEDLGSYAITVRSCGGGVLVPRVVGRGTLGPASCLEQMTFGADSGYADLWRLHLERDRPVTIHVASQNGVPLYVRVRGPGLDGGESDGDVDRLRFTPRQGGDYTVLVGQTAFERSTFPYTIRATTGSY